MLPSRRLLLGRLVVFAACAVFAARESRAHDQTYPIAGDSILIEADGGGGTPVFQFEADGPEVPFLDHDPREDGTQILVRGTGANAGRTALITLDRNLWAPTTNGFAYTDAEGTRGGVTSVVFEPGLFTIQAGAGFGWSPAGAQDEVWVSMRIGDTGLCSRFGSDVATSNGAGSFVAAGAAAPASCPAQVCGDGIPQAPEACDDGNLASNDGCEPTCEVGPCNAESFTSTFEAIQERIFDGGYGCTDGLCHDSVAPKNELDLTSGVSYAQLLGGEGTGSPSEDYPALNLVQPGEPEQSYLWIKLAAKTFPGLSFVVDPGTAMPSGANSALSEEHLEAVERWIRGGAPQEGVVEGTQSLLGTCLPPPTPLKIPPPPAPAPGTGVQFLQTPWPLPGTTPTTQGEDEICMATYYDVSQTVPEWAKVPCPPSLQPVKQCAADPTRLCSTDADCEVGDSCTGYRFNANNYEGGNNCFVYDRSVLHQDPQSHHSIIQLYAGGYDADDPSWGEWTYKFEPSEANPLAGQPCSPRDFDPATGITNPGCSTAVVSGVACGGFGPPDMQASLTGMGNDTSLSFTGSQEPYYDQTFAEGVYDVLPLAGLITWNSHAFNLTPEASTMAQYLNVEYAPEENQLYPLQRIFAARWIFAQDVPPFGTQEICGTYTIPEGAQLFELGSHTHQWGARWRTWEPPNTPCQPGCPTPYNEIPPQFGAFQLCNEDPELPICDGPREDPPTYTSTDYTDPLQLRFDPPLSFADTPDEADRTFLYCSLYDNGSTEDSPKVKLRSESPMPPGISELITSEVLNFFGAGGPCVPKGAYCKDGPNKGEACVAAPIATLNADDHALCGDPELELCDACATRGGVTTSDEMFILIGNYFIPEPGTTGLAAVALATIGALARKRNR
jgi:cysteine-rich repeat protein